MDAAKKTNIQKVLVAALLLVFLWTFLGTLRSLHGNNRSTARRSVATSSVQVAQPTVPEALHHLHEEMDAAQRQALQPADQPAPPSEVVPYTASGLRDPLVRLLPKVLPADAAASQVASQLAAKEPAPTPPAVTVQGIIWGTLPQALIDGKVCMVGDTVGGAKIVAIDRDGVKVDVRGSTFSLTTSTGGDTLGGLR